jgi:hypothetical protein
MHTHRKKAGPELAQALDKCRSPKTLRAAFEVWAASTYLNSPITLRAYKRENEDLFEDAERVGTSKNKDKAPPATSPFTRA